MQYNYDNYIIYIIHKIIYKFIAFHKYRYYFNKSSLYSRKIKEIKLANKKTK